MKKFFFLLIFLISFEARAKRVEKAYEEIPAKFFLQFDLTQNECEKIIGGECFRRDKMRDEPYYHKTKVTIFRGKIFAEQFFERTENKSDRLFLKVSNGTHQLYSENKNLVSFTIKDGVVHDLKLVKGDLDKEENAPSRCEISQALYGFYLAHDKLSILERSAFYKDEKNFTGLREFIMFGETSNPNEPFVVARNSPHSISAVENLNLCKAPNEENFLVKYLSDEECKTPTEENAVECSKYSACRDYLVVKNCEILLPKISED